jgi:hypothetical protein
VPVQFNQNLTRMTMAELFTQNVSGPGNGSVILVPSRGYSIVSDIDDVLRVTKVYQPLTGLRNSFAEVPLPRSPSPFLPPVFMALLFSGLVLTVAICEFHEHATIILSLASEFTWKCIPLRHNHPSPINKNLHRLYLQQLPPRKFRYASTKPVLPLRNLLRPQRLPNPTLRILPLP